MRGDTKRNLSVVRRSRSADQERLAFGGAVVTHPAAIGVQHDVRISGRSNHVCYGPIATE